MNSTVRYIIVGLSIVIGIFSVWYFLHIVSYILISAVLGLVGAPLVDVMGKVKIRKISIPVSIRAAIVLLFFWIVFILFFRVFIPLIASELNDLSQINTEQVLESLGQPLGNFERIVDEYHIAGEEKFVLEDFVADKLMSVLNIGFVTKLFSSFASVLGNVFLALFSITFITFFFLRDQSLFSEGILMLVPDKYVNSFRHAMRSVRYLLRRYFIGIMGQLAGIFTLVTAGMTIVGVGFSHAIIIGLIAALFNIIPYLGPLLGGATGVMMGIATHLYLDYTTELLPLVALMILVILIVQLIDNFVFQPLIYSSSVNAHPVEIFLVIMIAGSTPAGVAGMIIAIPTYTVLRVFAKEFFDQFKVVKKLTRKINSTR